MLSSDVVVLDSGRDDSASIREGLEVMQPDTLLLSQSVSTLQRREECVAVNPLGPLARAEFLLAEFLPHGATEIDHYRLLRLFPLMRVSS